MHDDGNEHHAGSGPRAALKPAVFNGRKVTVRLDHSTLRVTIRDASASLSTVKAIADQFESVRRCETTGEILCGGNTFVDVQYMDALVAPVAASVVALLASAADGEVVASPGGFRAAKMSRQRGATHPDEVRIVGPGFDHRNATACGVAFAAQRIAVAYLDAGALTPGSAAAAQPEEAVV
jgi:hypothetical protein